MKLNYLFAACLLFLTSCDTFDSKFSLINNRNNTIVYFLSDTTETQALEYFSSSELVNPDGIKEKIPFNLLKAKEEKRLMTLGYWEYKLMYPKINGIHT